MFVSPVYRPPSADTIVIRFTPSGWDCFSSGLAVSCVSPSMESLAVEMFDMLESSSMPRLARELSPSSVNNLLCFGSVLVFVLINWDTGIHLNCFMVVSGICIHRFSQCLTLSTLCITLLMSSFLLCRVSARADRDNILKSGYSLKKCYQAIK